MNRRLCPVCYDPMEQYGETTIKLNGEDLPFEYWECITNCPRDGGQRHRYFYPIGFITPRERMHVVG